MSRASDSAESEAERLAEAALSAVPRPGNAGALPPRARNTSSAGPGSGTVGAGAWGAGTPLAGSVRSDMEARFGVDFGSVRIHDDHAAHRTSRSLGARAFTHGAHISFAANMYAPDRPHGRRLLAHELAHVVQQQRGRAAPNTLFRAVDCTGQPSGVSITRVIVDQEAPQQQVTVEWSDGTVDSPERCSTGKGHCCVESGTGIADGGAACTQAGSTVSGSNCTPVGVHTVDAKIEVTGGGVEMWTQFHSGRSIALHKYRPVDGTPLSHGCVRLDEAVARRIYCGSRVGRTRVEVRGLARPMCSNDNLVAEWAGDLATAAQPPDGEPPRTQRSIRDTRRMLRGAMGIDDTELDSRIATAGGETRLREARRDAFIQAVSASPAPLSPATVATLADVRALIPRCGAFMTTEEAEAVPAAASASATVPSQLVTQAGFDDDLARLEAGLRGATSTAAATTVVRNHARGLWFSARSAATAHPADAEDRGLYWARLRSATAIRRWDTSRFDPDQLRRLKVDLIEVLERESRGLATASFRFAGDKRILVSGFDPFGVGSPIGARSNPSGAAVLALDGERIGSGSLRGDVQGVIFPVRFADFDQGIVENFFSPIINGSSPPHMIMTISQGGSQDFEVEEFAGRNRSFQRGSTPTQDNQRSTGGVTSANPIVEPSGLGSGTQTLRTSLPVSEVLATSRNPGDPAVVRDTSRVMEGGRARAGSGGSFLSNEIFYRTRLLVSQSGQAVRMGHLHTPLLRPPTTGTTGTTGSTATTDPAFADLRGRIVQMVRRILEATLPAL